MLVIDCCIRGIESSTRKYYEAYLEKYDLKDKCSFLYLTECDIKPMTAEMLDKRNSLIGERSFDDKIFTYAKQFAEADEILIAAPYWDLSFPSLLKAYFEHICVSGITFGYTEKGSLGFCKAKRLLYFTTCGGYTGKNDLGYEYVKALASMLGIDNCSEYKIEGLDIEPSRRNEILADAVDSLE